MFCVKGGEKRSLCKRESGSNCLSVNAAVAMHALRRWHTHTHMYILLPTKIE
jgi:hypothetical protein